MYPTCSLRDEGHCWLLVMSVLLSSLVCFSSKALSFWKSQVGLMLLDMLGRTLMQSLGETRKHLCVFWNIVYEIYYSACCDSKMNVLKVKDGDLDTNIEPEQKKKIVNILRYSTRLIHNGPNTTFYHSQNKMDTCETQGTLFKLKFMWCVRTKLVHLQTSCVNATGLNCFGISNSCECLVKMKYTCLTQNRFLRSMPISLHDLFQMI